MKIKNDKNSFKEKVKLKIKEIKDGIVYRKLKEVGILLNSFGKAFIDIFSVQKKDDVYVSLAPTKNADKDGTYCNALKYAIDNKEIKNIAITGNYGSGKSSVIKTFFNKLENKKYNPIYISLSAFNKEDYIDDSNKTSIVDGEVKGIQSRNEFYHTLEKSILQQLLYQANEKEVPLSRFKRITKHSKILLNIEVIGVICAISILILILFPQVIDTVVNNYNSVKERISELWTNMLIAILIGTIYVGIYKLLFFLSTKFNVSKFKIKDAEVEIDNKPESIFNKYLDEIIYFFQVTNHSIVVIEDLDRYEGNASFIFQKLRELNTLINSSNQIKYEVDFIYAIRDDFFKDYEERTKFFDYIVPIIPISSNGNSNEIIWKRLECLKKEGKIKYKFNKEFIDDIAITLEDKRLIDNIINEFIIYKNKMKNEHMDDKQMFSIIVYKNLYPEKYAMLQKNTGTIVNIFKSKKKNVKEIILGLNEQKDVLIQNKKQVQQENLNSVKELKYTLVSSIYDYENYVNYKKIFKFDNENVEISTFLGESIDCNKIESSNLKFRTESYGYINKDEKEIFKNFGNKTIFLERWKNIERGKDEKIKEIQVEIEKLNSEIQNISKLSLKQLLSKYDMEYIFEESSFEEKLFITKGYITEEYKNYITLFMPGNLTKEDNEFVSAVKTGEILPFDFKLTNVDNVLKRLNEGDFENKAILNFNLLEYLINNNLEKKILKIIELLNVQDESILEFIDDFIQNYESEEFIDLLIENANQIWKKIYTKVGNDEYINRWIIRFLKNENSLKNTDESFNQYVREHNCIDKYINNNNIIKNVINSLKKLNIKFENIQRLNNADFLAEVYSNNLYKLNTTMIKLMLQLKKVNIQEFDSKNLTLLFNTEKLKEYVITNFGEYYNYCYTLNSSDSDDENEILNVIKNTSIDVNIRKQIVDNEKFSSYNLDNIELEVIKEIIIKDKMNITYDNILYLFEKNNEKINEDIIYNMKLHINEYKNEDIDQYSEKYGEETIEKFKISYIFNDEIGLDEFKILTKTFNIKILELEECNEKKLEYLIDENIVEFNVNNFNYIKENANSKVIIFVIQNMDNYLENIDEYDISECEDELLLNSKISIEAKISIVNNINIEELSNNTLLYLINNGILNTEKANINERIVNDKDIDIESKLIFVKLMIHQELLSKDIITGYIHVLGEEYESINTQKNASNILFNNENLELSKTLKEKGYISSYKKGRNNNIILYNKVNR